MIILSDFLDFHLLKYLHHSEKWDSGLDYIDIMYVMSFSSL